MKPVSSFNVVGVDPLRFWSDGYGYWREDGKIFRDDVLVTVEKEDAYLASVSCGQICFLHVSYEGEPNGYLLELDEEVLRGFFEEEKITGYTVISNPKRLEGIPECFTVISKEEAERLDVAEEALRPVYYEFCYVKK